MSRGRNRASSPSARGTTTTAARGVSGWLATLARPSCASSSSPTLRRLERLATRGTLPSLFGLDTPILLDVLAMGLLAYAGALAIAARRLPVSRQTLMAFTVADAIWVGGSAVVLVVEAFATLQFRAAGKIAGHSAQIA